MFSKGYPVVSSFVLRGIGVPESECRKCFSRLDGLSSPKIVVVEMESKGCGQTIFYLLGGLEHQFYFSDIGNFTIPAYPNISQHIPTDMNSYFSEGWRKTTNQNIMEGIPESAVQTVWLHHTQHVWLQAVIAISRCGSPFYICREVLASEMEMTLWHDHWLRI